MYKKQKGNNKIKWFDNDLRNIKSENNNRQQRARLENTIESWCSYKSIRNVYKVKIENV